jgi:Tfp pilus assembly protein PilX
MSLLPNHQERGHALIHLLLSLVLHELLTQVHFRLLLTLAERCRGQT